MALSTATTALVSLFVILVIFSFVTALMIHFLKIINRNYMYCWRIVLFVLTFCSLGKCDDENTILCHGLDWRGWRYMRQFDQLCWINGLLEPIAPLKLPNRKKLIPFCHKSLPGTVWKLFSLRIWFQSHLVWILWTLALLVNTRRLPLEIEID